jgi:hypothetical protein
MKNCYLIFTGMAAFLAMLFFAVAPKAQQRPNPRQEAAAAKPTPKMTDGHPDFTGFWLDNVAGLSYQNNDGASEDGNLKRLPDGSTIFLYGGAIAGIPAEAPASTAIPANAPPYKPEYMAKVQDIVKTIYGDANTSSPYDPMNDCKPDGVPRAGISGAQIFMNPSGVAVMYENSPGPVYRIIYTDGRQHPKDLDTSYMGHSIGHWEGDTLVIDTVGLNDETWLGRAKYQNIHSDKEHVIERWTRTGDILSRTVTVEDPVMFSKPWTFGPEKVTLGNKNDYIQPEMCRTNDKAHLQLQTETNQYKCNWCQVDADAVYGTGAAADNKKNAPTRGFGGGGAE